MKTAVAPLTDRVFLAFSGLGLQSEPVRFWLVILGFSIPLLGANAQDQERKLVDRILKPDMTLQNSQQNRNFSQRTVTRTQAARTSEFYVADKKLVSNFVIDRRVTTTSYIATNFATGRINPPKSQQSRTFSTGIARPASMAADGAKSVSTREFASNRKFTGRGKSQKSLDAQHHSLTIEEVRELLNKNK